MRKNLLFIITILLYFMAMNLIATNNIFIGIIFCYAGMIVNVEELTINKEEK